ncbi:ABC transporter permease [Crocosphaera sp. XPORK-15E]|uniref:ABC transporter permease n=1 Tax=Crocosphaera sp. XPORK-15E TaxID=3110247 RepID=UPI002B200B1B|nr:ABC transporter permease [Crocosphaera sp. XPORK-15E]MEA5534967.1 ABC transporter permease [Crocosphaera sp. XPORK-15E]
MNLLESFKMASSMLAANKLRTSLTMLGMIIGNASVIATIGIGQGAQNLATEQLNALGPTVIFIVPGTRKNRRATFNLPRTLVWEDAQVIASLVSSIKAVAPEINQRQLISYRSQNTNVLLIGTTPQYTSVRSFPVATGRFLNEIDVQRNKRVAVIGSAIADRLFVANSPIGERIRVKNITFEVIGVMEKKGSFFGTNLDETVLIPLTTMANQIVGRTSPYGVELTWINAEAKDVDSVREAKFQIENLLRLRHKITNEDDFGVETAKQMLDIVGNIATGLTAMLTVIAGISLVVGGIGVMNIMLVSVSERTSEIGLRKALGATQSDILGQFLIEAVIISISGGIIGIMTGVSLITLVGIVSPLSPGISSSAIIISLVVSGGIGLGFGVLPAQRAAKLDPIVALRSS